MSVKSDCTLHQKKGPVFPKLMIVKEGFSAGKVVLFSQPGEGTVVCRGNGSDHVGHHYDGWLMSAFSDFEGSVTLTND